MPAVTTRVFENVKISFRGKLEKKTTARDLVRGHDWHRDHATEEPSSVRGLQGRNPRRKREGNAEKERGLHFRA